MLTGVVLRGIPDGSTSRKYGKGVALDARNDFRRLMKLQTARQHHVSLFIGEHDLIFPLHEITESLQAAGIMQAGIRILPGASHIPPSAASMHSALGDIISSVRSDNA